MFPELKVAITAGIVALLFYIIQQLAGVIIRLMTRRLKDKITFEVQIKELQKQTERIPEMIKDINNIAAKLRNIEKKL